MRARRSEIGISKMLRADNGQEERTVSLKVIMGWKSCRIDEETEPGQDDFVAEVSAGEKSAMVET